jgi:hypothetical protein
MQAERAAQLKQIPQRSSSIGNRKPFDYQLNTNGSRLILAGKSVRLHSSIFEVLYAYIGERAFWNVEVNVVRLQRYGNQKIHREMWIAHRIYGIVAQ